MTTEHRIEVQRRVVAEHIGAENAHNWPDVYQTFHQDERAYFDVMPLATRFDGISGVRGFYEIIESAFPDFSVTTTGEYDLPGTSIRELTLTATHTGEYCGVAPQGHRVLVELAVFYLFGEGADAGKLLGERVYFDNEVLLRQCRGEAPAAGLGLAGAGGR